MVYNLFNMEESLVKNTAKNIESVQNINDSEPSCKVEPVEPIEKQDIDHSTENLNETPKNTHPYLGHNLDVIG